MLQVYAAPPSPVRLRLRKGRGGEGGGGQPRSYLFKRERAGKGAHPVESWPEGLRMEPSQPLRRLPGARRLQLLLLMLLPEWCWGKYVKGNLSTKEVSLQVFLGLGGWGLRGRGERRGPEPIPRCPVPAWAWHGRTQLLKAAIPAPFAIFCSGPGCEGAGKGGVWAPSPPWRSLPPPLPPHIIPLSLEAAAS